MFLSYPEGQFNPPSDLTLTDIEKTRQSQMPGRLAWGSDFSGLVWVFLQHLTKWGPRASPAQRVAWGEGGDPEHSRKNGKRIQRLPFLSRAEGSPTLVRATGLEPAWFPTGT